MPDRRESRRRLCFDFGECFDMKAFVTGVVAAIVIAIIAGLALSRLPHDAGSAHQSPTSNVRL
jgi:hypothetical protein